MNIRINTENNNLDKDFMNNVNSNINSSTGNSTFSTEKKIRKTTKERRENRMPRGDLISNSITAIRNGYLAKKKTIYIPNTNYIRSILAVLKSEGYIVDFETETDNYKYPKIAVHLRYGVKGPAILKIKIVSTPSKAVHMGYDGLKEYYKDKCYGGYGTAILSTSNEGILAGWKAREKKIGGKILFTVM